MDRIIFQEINDPKDFINKHILQHSTPSESQLSTNFD